MKEFFFFFSSNCNFDTLIYVGLKIIQKYIFHIVPIFNVELKNDILEEKIID